MLHHTNFHFFDTLNFMLVIVVLIFFIFLWQFKCKSHVTFYWKKQSISYYGKWKVMFWRWFLYIDYTSILCTTIRECYTVNNLWQNKFLFPKQRTILNKFTNWIRKFIFLFLFRMPNPSYNVSEKKQNSFTQSKIQWP